MAKRIYIVSPTKAEAGSTVAARLVRAHNQAQALRHVVKDYQATVAGQDDLVRALQAQVKVENAGDEPEAAAVATVAANPGASTPTGDDADAGAGGAGLTD